MAVSRRLMILGAGAFQIAAIRRARQLGHHVITVDDDLRNPGHRFSHESLECSTADAAGVLTSARSSGIDGVFTMASDVAIPALAHVCAELGLLGPSRDVARLFTRKDVLREFQVTSGFDHPAWVHGSDFDEVRTHLGKLPHELVVKPADTSGSRGVALMNASDERALSFAFTSATAHSRSNTACVEEFIDGEDVTVEGFLAGGRVALACVTRKFKHRLAVNGHRLPGRLNHEQEERACAVVAEHLRAAGYSECRNYRPRWTHCMSIGVQNLEVGHEQCAAGRAPEEEGVGAR
jgi:phosphoribosylamine-glycine ligase